MAWHLAAGPDGWCPGVQRFHGIKPGETFTYQFPIRQSGTYWYHSHSRLQEQAGVYAPLIFDPATPEPFRFDRDYVVMFSDFTSERPEGILNNLKVDSDYYNYHRRTLFDFFRQVGKDGFGSALKDWMAWGRMRMSPTDLSDVSGYTFLVNGKSPAQNETLLFKPGERVRLRLINGSAMSFLDVRIPGLKMAVVQADGQSVVPVPVDDLRMAIAETYDVIVLPKDEGPYTIFAEPIDRTGYARATLATRTGVSGPIPARRPRTLLTMGDMGMSMPGMDHGGMPGMDHGTMPGMDEGAGGGDEGSMEGMDHGAMDGSSMPDASAPPVGWAATGAPPDSKVLDYADLRAFAPDPDLREPDRTITMRLTGNMQRFIWTIDGKRFEDAEPIRLKYNERVRIKFVNETMMAHPMHLHGMFLELENGQTDRKPRKHVINVPPGKTVSALLTANEPGEWPFHCHLLFHMASGMMTKVIVAPRAAGDAS